MNTRGRLAFGTPRIPGFVVSFALYFVYLFARVIIVVLNDDDLMVVVVVVVVVVVMSSPSSDRGCVFILMATDDMAQLTKIRGGPIDANRPYLAINVTTTVDTSMVSPVATYEAMYRHKHSNRSRRFADESPLSFKWSLELHFAQIVIGRRRLLHGPGAVAYLSLEGFEADRWGSTRWSLVRLDVEVGSETSTAMDHLKNQKHVKGWKPWKRQAILKWRRRSFLSMSSERKPS